MRAQQIVAPVKTRIAPPHVAARTGPGRPAAQVVAQTPAPTPHPVTTARFVPAGCSKPDTDAAIVTKPDASALTSEARASKVNGVTAVEVSLDATGAVLNAKVARSSGNDGLDAGAVTMARNATYSPKYVGCKGVAGTYTFTVRFVAW